MEVTKESSEKKWLHNPLNMHGNAFQGLSAKAISTRPATPVSVSPPELKKESNNDRHSTDYPLNKQGGHFQGISPNYHLFKTAVPQKIADELFHEESEMTGNLDECLFDDYPLFMQPPRQPEPEKDFKQENSASVVKPFNPDYYRTSYYS